MSRVAITDARARLASIIDDAQREPVSSTRRDRPIAAIVDADVLQQLMDDAGESADIRVLPAAVRSIRQLPPEAERRVQAVIELLAEDPRPPAANKLSARPEWRVRTGDYRVIYRIEDAVLTVVVVR